MTLEWLATGKGQKKRVKSMAESVGEEAAALIQSVDPVDVHLWRECTRVMMQVARETGHLPTVDLGKFINSIEFAYYFELDNRKKAVAAGQTPPEIDIDYYRRLVRAFM